MKGNEFAHMMMNVGLKYYPQEIYHYNNWWLRNQGTELFRRNALGIHLFPFLDGKGPIYIRRSLTLPLDKMAELFVQNNLVPNKEHAEQIIPYLVGQKAASIEGFEIELSEVPFNRLGKDYKLFWRYSTLEERYS